MANLDDQFKGAIHNIFEERLKEIQEEFIQKAVKEYDRKLREVVTETAISVSRYYSVETNGENLTIKIYQEPRR